MENPTDWSAELEEIVQDLLMEALTVELCRRALFRRREEGDLFPSQVFSLLLKRSGDYLNQRAQDLKVFSQAVGR